MRDLDKFKNEMNLSGQNVYVGHRYVPKIMGDWDNLKLYEPLSIVQYQGNSFTSRKYVPTGVEITNEDYWASTGNYNAQIEQYRQDVRNLENDVNNFSSEVITARNGEANLSDRLDKEQQEVTTQLGNIAINVDSFGAKGDGVTDDTTAIQSAIDSLTNGGTVTLTRGKTYIVRKLSAASNVSFNLNGSTLKQKSNVPIYTNVIDVGDKGLVTNFKVYNGKIDGNKENQTVEFYRYGIYTLMCDGVIMEDLEIFNFTGEGIFVGYTGYYSKNIYINRVHLRGNLRNDLAITNAENVYVDDLVVDSIAYDSASIDLELQHDTDNIINVHFRNLFVKSSAQQAKIVKNGFDGTLKNITINNAVFTGSKSLGIEDADNVTLSNIQSTQGIEIIGCRDVLIDGMKILGSTKNGLYIYKNVINGNITRNITLNNIDVSGSKGYGILLQDVDVATLSNVQSYNNTGNGVGVLYNNKNINMINVISTDRRTTDKTQPYGIEFQGVNSNLQIMGGDFKGNVTGDFLNLPSNINLMTRNIYRFTSPNGVGSHALEYGNDNTLTFGAFFAARRFSLTSAYDNAVDVIPNGSIYEDKNDGKLKYKSQSGVISTLSN